MSSEEQELQHKRAKGESEVEKRVESDSVYILDKFFEEGDSDAEDDFSITHTRAEDLDHPAYYLAFERKERRCLDLHVCHKFQHMPDFQGLPLFEIFKVKLKLNKNYCTTPISGRPYGDIIIGHDPISYYSATPAKPDSIYLDHDKYNFVLPISGPEPRPLICDGNTSVVALDLAFKINDHDLFTPRRENLQLFDDDDDVDRLSRVSKHYILRTVVGEPSRDPVLMGVYYSVYEGAYAKIDVKMLRDDVRGFHGLILARPCIFYRRFRLLTIQPGPDKVAVERGEDGKVDEESRSIKLTRSIVAVPTYSSLIIGAALFVGDNNTICRDKVAFPARESGMETKSIFHQGVEILKVIVQWNPQG